jgi:threonine dehydrogenase-like Zn-dependent dehydrogenase
VKNHIGPGARRVDLAGRRESRAETARLFGAAFATPGEIDAAGAGADVVFHASATAEGLALALDCGGLEAAIVETSWYGNMTPAAPLGAGFHAKRLRLLSSQVGHVAPSRRPRWSYGRRLDKALTLLVDDRLDALITQEIAFADLPGALPAIFAPGAAGLCAVVRY